MWGGVFVPEMVVPIPVGAGGRPGSAPGRSSRWMPPDGRIDRYAGQTGRSGSIRGADTLPAAPSVPVQPARTTRRRPSLLQPARTTRRRPSQSNPPVQHGAVPACSNLPGTAPRYTVLPAQPTPGTILCYPVLPRTTHPCLVQFSPCPELHGTADAATSCSNPGIYDQDSTRTVLGRVWDQWCLLQ